MKKTEVYVIVDTPKKANYCTIQLTQGKYTIVDSDDFDLLNRYNWHFQSRGYACNEKLGLLHRFITNCPKGMVVDHINGDKLDNRKENLRICTQTQNTFNSKGVDNKTSKYKGVSWAKIKNKWKAQIHINKKNTYLGLFDSEIDAAKKYDEIAYSLYGDFAKLNFIRYATEEEKALLDTKKELEVGKWYKGNIDIESLIFITEIENVKYYNRIHGYGFKDGQWNDASHLFSNTDHEKSLVEATHEEVERALIEEAKRRYKVGDKLSEVYEDFSRGNRIFSLNLEHQNGLCDLWINSDDSTNYYSCIFKNGKWATIVEHDKLSNLKEAHRNGAVIQANDGEGWYDTDYPNWLSKEYRIKTEEIFTDKDISIVERLHDTLLDNHGYSLGSKLLTDARMLADKIKSNIK